MTHALLILSRRADDYRRPVEAARLPGLSIVSATSGDALPAGAASCDIVFGEPALIAPVLASLPRVHWIQSTWAGVEPLLDPALRRDYVLTNARGVFGTLMSEYVFGYMLAHERRMFETWAAQQERRWVPSPPGTLKGRQVGLLGVGSIGAAIARTAKHFGMRVKGYTRTSRSCPDVDEYFHGDQRLAFAADLDYLVCIVPNTAGTRLLVDRALLEALPPRAVVINPGRGSVLDETALAELLAAGRLGGAVLDVFHTEPLPADHVLWGTPHVVITPHNAAISNPAEIAPLFIDNYRRLLAGEPLMHRVDFDLGY